MYFELKEAAMPFLDDPHLARMQRFDLIYQRMVNLEKFAADNGVEDIFQDNGAKIVQQISILNLEALAGREGNDAVDESGTEWELKSLNIDKVSGCSTNHHLNQGIIDKYRTANWAFSFYRGIHLVEIYIMQGSALEPYYQKWERQLQTQPTINNPKIPVRFIRENGYLAYPIDYDSPIDPADPSTWHH